MMVCTMPTISWGPITVLDNGDFKELSRAVVEESSGVVEEVLIACLCSC